MSHWHHTNTNKLKHIQETKT